MKRKKRRVRSTRAFNRSWRSKPERKIKRKKRREGIDMIGFS